jgi:hypothetical protein
LNVEGKGNSPASTNEKPGRQDKMRAQTPIEKKIRVNEVASGPIWAPLIP